MVLSFVASRNWEQTMFETTTPYITKVDYIQKYDHRLSTILDPVATYHQSCQFVIVFNGN